MIVNINLLPQREKRNIAIYFVLLVFFIIISSAIMFLYVMMQNEEISKSSKQQQLTSVSAQLIEQNKSQQSSETQSEISKLQTEINQLKDSTISAVFVIDQLTKQLPKYGVFDSLNYEKDGSIELQVNFNEKREAIYYFARLQKLDWIKQIKISSIEAEKDNTNIENVELVYSDFVANYAIELNTDELKKLKEDAE